MSRKTFDLSNESIQILEKAQKENGFKTQKQTLEYILHSYQSNNDIDRNMDAFVNALDKKYFSKDRLRWSLQTAEQNTIIILDILNTYLLRNHIDKGIPVDILPSPVIENSRKRIQEKIAHSKQPSQERRSKQSM